MSTLDWVVMAITLAFILLYGLYKNRNDKDIDGYLLGNKSLPWYHVGFSVMATQASSITFLSAPGQAFTSGMGFVQFYFGLPLAMIVLSITFIPIFQRLKVFTAYEFLEERFGVRVRIFTSLLFLLQRGAFHHSFHYFRLGYSLHQYFYGKYCTYVCNYWGNKSDFVFTFATNAHCDVQFGFYRLHDCQITSSRNRIY